MASSPQSPPIADAEAAAGSLPQSMARATEAGETTATGAETATAAATCTADAAAGRASPQLHATSSLSASPLDLSTFPLVAAPMVGQSDVAWRMLLRRHGAQLVYTQMLEADRFVRESRYRQEMFLTCCEDRPLIVQFAANDADTFVQAAKLVEPYCDGQPEMGSIGARGIDLNLGCPQRAARSGLFGAYLLDEEHHDRVFSMLRAGVAQLRVPVLAKIRLLPSLARTLSFCEGLRACGIAGLAVHGRTRGFVEERRKGPADLTQVRAVVQAMKRSRAGAAAEDGGGQDDARALPVWSNGNVRREQDVADNLALTGAAGCMIGEALLNDPTLCARIHVRADTDVSGAHAPTISMASPPAEVSLSLTELRRKLAIVEEYLDMIRQPSFEYFTPFADADAAAAATPMTTGPAITAAIVEAQDQATPCVMAPGAPSVVSPLLRSAAAVVNDDEWRTPLVSFSSFQSHVYRMLNADPRARFLYHTQLGDEFLDATTLGQMKAVMRAVESRIAAGRPFDPALQGQIDAQRGARQAARVQAEKDRMAAASGVRVMNSKQRKRARWQQRKADAKRIKAEEGEEVEEGVGGGSISTPVADLTPPSQR